MISVEIRVDGNAPPSQGCKPNVLAFLLYADMPDRRIELLSYRCQQYILAIELIGRILCDGYDPSPQPPQGCVQP